jgi:rhodanese-related sulfurtransferase
MRIDTFSRMSIPLILVAVLAPAAAADPPAGQRLFERFGCTNCHGPRGANPTSEHAPVLRGRSVAELLAAVDAIFGGGGRTAAAAIMHEQFCVGEAPAEGCYPVPNAGERRLIAEWLAEEPHLPAGKRTPQGLYATSLEAYERLRRLGDRGTLIDIRTRAEVAFLGMPSLAKANIPYLFVDLETWDDERDMFRMVPNGRFVQDVDALMKELGLDKDSPVYLICRSGSRSAKAARLLHANGYTQVYTVTDGFEGDKAKSGPQKGQRVVNGWKNSGLPWTYKLPKEAMYLKEF